MYPRMLYFVRDITPAVRAIPQTQGKEMDGPYIKPYGEMIRHNLEREAATEDALNALARLSRNIKELKAYFTKFEASEGKPNSN